MVLGVALALLVANPAAGATPSTIRIAFIPMDDRPVSEQFPLQTAAICGSHVELPPASTLGHFTTPGDPDALGRWLLALDPVGLSAVVVSSDMLAYGGLVASRRATTQLADARAHLQPLVRFHESHPGIPIYVFGTIMRLAPTETPQSEPYLEALTNYARSAGVEHPTGDDKAALADSRAKVPDSAFWDYIGARARDLQIDQQLVAMTSRGDIAWLALTQDDAGSLDGLQASEQRTLAAAIARLGLGDRVYLNPGADEMGMVTVTRAIEDATEWSGALQIEFSMQDGPTQQDPLEDVPVGKTIDNLARALKLSRNDRAPLSLYVFSAGTPAGEREYFFGELAQRLRSGDHVAIADLTFIDDDLMEERIAYEALNDAHVAAKPMSFASWNTTANAAGTALSAAACFEVAKRFGLSTEAARQTFLFNRYVDDYAYRLLVRPELNARLRSEGYDTFALASSAADVEIRVRQQLWPLAVEIFDDGFAQDGWKQSGLGIYLPWQRTFEVRLDTKLSAAPAHT